MKCLIVGGRAQGKLDYLLRRGDVREEDISFCDSCPLDEIGSKQAIYRLERLAFRLLELGQDPGAWISPRLIDMEEWVVICDEVGCGVVPVDRRDRHWRETVGRLCCDLAGQADRVIRICCGLPVALKGELL